MPELDLIEVFNSRTMLLRDSARTIELVKKHGLPCTAGSDAHVVREVGSAYIEMPEFNDAEQFRQALKQGRVYGHRTNPLIHSYGIRDRLVKLFRRS
jgi:predicted metal-dependent phosphoesterase TrpH